MEPLLQMLLIPGRIRFRWRNRNRRKVTAGLIQVLQKRCAEAGKTSLTCYQDAYNAGLFVVLLEQDISAFSEAIYFSRTEWHRQFHARNLAVLLYEGSEDVPQVLGKKYRAALTDMGLGSDWMASLNSITGKLSRFKQEHGQFLNRIRNLVGAHKDHNCSAQLEILDGLKAAEVYALGAKFSVPLRELVDFNIQLLQHMHNPMVMVRAIAKTLPVAGQPNAEAEK